MNFNEKLMELRKKTGLSQEELGYKLNVTRQTVSKWELGQTTPEMDKLTEISKIFNVSIDELTNESELTSVNNIKIEDQPINEKGSQSSKTAIIIIAIVVILGIIIAGIGIKLFTGVFTKVFDFTKDEIEQVGDIVESTIEMQKDMMEKTEDRFEIVQNKIDSNNIQLDMENVLNNTEISIENDEKMEEHSNKMSLMQFNGKLEIYSGITMGGTVTHVLDIVIQSNKKEDKKISVEYLEKEAIETEDEIKKIKQEIETFDNYEISFEYDDEGYIYKTIIEKI